MRLLFRWTLLNSIECFRCDLQSHLTPCENVISRSFSPRDCKEIQMPGMKQSQSLGVERQGQDKAYSLLLTITDLWSSEQDELLFAT